MDRRRQMLALLMSIPPPPDHNDFIEYVHSVLVTIICRPPPSLNIKQRLFPELDIYFQGRDVFGMFWHQEYDFFEITGETPQTFISLSNEIILPGSARVLSKENKLLLVFLWLRSYPSYHFLSTLFNISVSTVKELIKLAIPILDNHFDMFLEWPTITEWENFRNQWPKLPMAVGAIDGTSHEVYRPVHGQRQYYSGHRQYHCIHSQVVVDCTGRIRHIETGFLGHQNDAQQFNLMSKIGHDLPFPDQCVLLADKIYPNRFPLMTPYTSAQIRRRDNRRQCRRLNRTISKYRIVVEHAIAEIKAYKCVSSIWRHKRHFLAATVRLVAKLVVRRKLIGLIE